MESQSSSGCFKSIGCIVVVIGLAGICVCGGGLVGIFSVVTGAIKSSQPYSDGLAKAQASPEVQQALGEPIEAGWLITGSINVNNDDGDCDIAVPVSGPKGSGVLHVRATKTDGDWTYERMEVQIDEGGQRIDLLAE